MRRRQTVRRKISRSKSPRDYLSGARARSHQRTRRICRDITMSAPASQIDAARIARSLLGKSMPGSRRGSVKGHLERAAAIADAIWRHFHVGPYQWQAKHLRWYLEHHIVTLAPTSRYDRWRTIRALAVALARMNDWEAHLKGPWLRPTGDGRRPLQEGRPPKLPGNSRKTR